MVKCFSSVPRITDVPQDWDQRMSFKAVFSGVYDAPLQSVVFFFYADVPLQICFRIVFMTFFMAPLRYTSVRFPETCKDTSQ